MKILKLLVTSITLSSLFISCVEDRCKTCEHTTYLVIDEEQHYLEGVIKNDYCGEELDELMNTEYTVDSVYNEETEITFVYTTFITCY